jgi:hypothetical protein
MSDTFQSSSSTSTTSSSIFILCILQGIVLIGLFLVYILRISSRYHLFHRGKAQPYIYSSSSVQELLIGDKCSYSSTLFFTKPSVFALYSSGNRHHLRRLEHNGVPDDIKFEFDIVIPQSMGMQQGQGQGQGGGGGIISERVVSFPILMLSNLVDKINKEILYPKYTQKTTKQRKFGEVTSPFSILVLALTSLFAVFPISLLISNSIGNELLPPPLLTGLAFISASGTMIWFYIAITYIFERREISELIVSLVPDISRFLSQSREVNFLLVSKSIDVSVRVSKGILWSNVDIIATLVFKRGATSLSLSSFSNRTSQVAYEPHLIVDDIEEDDPVVVDVSRSNSAIQLSNSIPLPSLSQQISPSLSTRTTPTTFNNL